MNHLGAGGKIWLVLVSKSIYNPVLLATTFFTFASGTKLTAMDATNAQTLATSTSPRPESNGRRPGAGFGQKSIKQIQICFCLPEQDRGKTVQLRN